MEQPLTRLVHISDLHFGANSRAAAAALTDAIGDLDPSLIVATGDLTQNGRRSEFADAARFLSALPAPFAVIPGNHDVSVYNPFQRFASPWRRFRSAIGREPNSTHADDNLLLIALNSARRAGPSLDWSLGRLTQRQVNETAEALREAPPSQLRVVALHHPVIATPGRAGQAIIPNAAHVMTTFNDAGAEIILTGHAHRSSAVEAPNVEGLVVVSAGTALSTRTRGEPPSFNLVSWNAARIEVVVFDYDDTKFTRRRQFQFQRKTQMANNAKTPPPADQ